jgi:hypothetical protein
VGVIINRRQSHREMTIPFPVKAQSSGIGIKNRTHAGATVLGRPKSQTDSGGRPYRYTLAGKQTQKERHNETNDK